MRELLEQTLIISSSGDVWVWLGEACFFPDLLYYCCSFSVLI